MGVEVLGTELLGEVNVEELDGVQRDSNPPLHFTINSRD